MKDKETNPAGQLISILTRLFLAFCISILFNLICFGLLQWEVRVVTVASEC